jgi:tricorn protease
VEAATGGRVGYFHVPDTQLSGISEFGKSFYAMADKDALIVDERYNGGGFIPTFFVEKLGRKMQSMFTPRYGSDRKNPSEAVYGPKVILANEYAGSGGDAFPYYFRKYGVGPVIGRRTWGGLVGISGNYALMDGGTVTIPQFGIWSQEEKKWIAENHGVEPDIDVLNSPDLTSTGKDPQLDRAISYIEDELKKHPPAKYQHPPFPVEKFSAANK